jgi:hypothetical protein
MIFLYHEACHRLDHTPDNKYVGGVITPNLYGFALCYPQLDEPSVFYAYGLFQDQNLQRFPVRTRCQATLARVPEELEKVRRA